MQKKRYQTYVISLETKPTVLDCLIKNNLDPKLVKGVDGRTCDRMQLLRHFHPLYVSHGPRSAQGCAMSHLKVWRKFLKSDNEFALIFEDDVILEPKFTSQLEKLFEQIPTDFDMFNLGAFGSEDESNFFTLVLGVLGMTQTPRYITEKIKVPKIALAMHAYVLSRKGASKLLNLLDGKLNNHIDFCIQALSIDNQINRYVATPRLAYQTSTDGIESKSANVSSNHPISITSILDKIYIDTRVRASYVSGISVARIGEQVISVSSLLFLLIGFILAMTSIQIETVSFAYLVISLPDIWSSQSSKDLNTVLFHYVLLVVPILILRRQRFPKNDELQ